MTGSSAPAAACPGAATSRSGDRVVLLGLLLLAGGLFFFRLGTPGLFDADEPAYAQAAREMLRTGDWITPHFNGQPRFDKPILFYWLIALAYRVFGVTEFAVRLWSAAAGVGLTLLLAAAARRRFGPPADLWTGVAFVTCLLTALLARAAVTDMLLALFVSVTVLAAAEALGTEGARATRKWALLAWGAAALGVLVKGPIGVLIPAMALLPALWIRGELGSLRRLLRWDAALLFAAMALPWYGLVLAANGRAFVDGFLLKHHVTRYVGVVSSHGGPLWFYLPVLLVGFFPWSGFLPRAVWRAWRTARRRAAEDAADRLLLICIVWAGGLLVFFSLAGTKLPSYLFPAVPALALLVGHDLARALAPARSPEDQPPRWLARLAAWLIAATGLLLAAGMAALPLVLERLRPLSRGVLDDAAVPLALPLALAGWLLLGTLVAARRSGAAQAGALAAMMAGLLLAAAVLVAPQVYAIVQAPLRALAEEARTLLSPDDPIVVYGLNAPTIVFYADRRVHPLGPGDPAGLETLARAAAAGRPVAVITRQSLAPRLRAIPTLAPRPARGGYVLLVSR
jgi:4-amino-4-deoxy-L-arabinose transferase-like glycosyltransferase